MHDAYQDGVRLLARRPLTRHEVAAKLLARGHPSDEVDRALSKLTLAGAIDDAALARRAVGTRARGRERTIAELTARGVDASLAAAAWEEALREGAIDEDDLAARAVRRRLGPPRGAVPLPRLARVYNALLSEGFASDKLEAALAPYGFQGIDP